MPAKKNKKSKNVKESIRADAKNPLIKWAKAAFGARSVATLILGAAIIYSAFSYEWFYYEWTWDKILSRNWKEIRKNPNASLTKRYKLKLGDTFDYLMRVRQSTPKDAVILFPFKKQLLTEAGGAYKLNEHITNKNWATYFLYPRRIVYMDEAAESPIFDSVGWVVIFNGAGYDQLDYEVTHRSSFEVIPKHKTE